jgi:hypothetical protein
MNMEKPKDENIKQTTAEEKYSTGELTPKDRLQNQMRLATIIYAKMHEKNFDAETIGGRNDIMYFWTQATEGEISFSEIYRNIENDPSFEDHSKYKGDIYKITVEDIEYYKENKTLPPYSKKVAE